MPKKRRCLKTKRNRKNYLPLMRELIVRDLKLKYRRSVLGYLWSLLNPLLMMIVLTNVFSYMFRVEVENFPLYLICGQTIFNFFSESTNMAMFSVIQNGGLIKKVYVPKEIFPISRILSSYITTLLSLLAIVIVMIFTHSACRLTGLMFFIPFLLVLVFSCGVGLILSALAVQFRDVTHLYSVVTLAWMYLSAIFYPIGAVPENMKVIILHNPMYVYISMFRSLLIDGVIPQAGIFIEGTVVALGMFALGLFVFKKMEDRFILYI